MLTLAERIEHALVGVGGSVAWVTGLGQMQMTHKGGLAKAGTRCMMELPATGTLSSHRFLLYPEGGGL
jgi:hypothetical protein